MNIKIIAGVTVLIVMLLSKKPLLFLLKLITNCAFGMAVIYAVNSILPAAGVGYNQFSIAVSAVFGIPGSILLCLLQGLL